MSAPTPTTSAQTSPQPILRRRESPDGPFGATLAKSLARPSDLPPLGPSDPIPLDSADPRYSAYLEQVRKMIKEKLGYPCTKKEGAPSCEYKAAELELEFGILKDGRVQFVEVKRGSAYAIYDEYAVNAVRQASPFPPVPPEMMATRPGSTGVPIRARFIYSVTNSR
jgi:TonB family protein